MLMVGEINRIHWSLRILVIVASGRNTSLSEVTDVTIFGNHGEMESVIPVL